MLSQAECTFVVAILKVTRIILECEGQIFSKSKDLSDALETLSCLRGKPHQLLSAAVIYEDGKPVWRKVGRAQLFMRNFSDTFLKT